MNAEPEGTTPTPSHPFRWFPEFFELSKKRLRPQARLLGLALVVGVIAGVGAVVFFVACQLVFTYRHRRLSAAHAGRRAQRI